MRTCNFREWEDVAREPNERIFEAKKMQVASGRVRVKMTLHSVLGVVTVITNRVT